MLRPSSAELDAGWALRPMRVDRGRVYPSKALLGSARSSSQTTSDITKNAMASLPQLMPNPCQPSASRLMKSYGYGLPPAAGPDPGQIAARASTKTKYAGKYANNLWHVCRVVRRHQEERHQCGDYGVHSQAPLKPCRRLNTFEQCGRAGPQHHDAQHETGLEREIHPELRFGPCLICAHEAETGDRKAPQRHDESHASSLPLRQWAVWCGWRIGWS